jgi:hypothetical protein
VIGHGFHQLFGAQMETVYTSSVMRPAPAPITSEESPYFDLSALSFSNEATVSIVDSAGMFAYPSVSPINQWREKNYQVAYLQSIFIEQSDTSRYRLMSWIAMGQTKKCFSRQAIQMGLNRNHRLGSSRILKARQMILLPSFIREIFGLLTAER